MRRAVSWDLFCLTCFALSLFGCGGATSRSGSVSSPLPPPSIALHSFKGGSDGANPFGLIVDGAGNLYGTTTQDGSNCPDSPLGCGTVFKLTNNGVFATLHTFSGGPSDGAVPQDG